ncbi:MAG TPA: PPOX class F420-dependent oxidoreductase [Anaerolineae bacterium]|jgi:PPOX class probable F420-dependent enzyme|nr:PPOX class F420-dependent oxidoreductase [Anaerolineae bacterium]
MTNLIPESHLDLLLGPVDGVLTTMMPDGQPQMSIVWGDYNGEHVLINTTLERQKGKNMLANPLVNVLMIDPQNGARFLEVRGEVDEITQDGAIAHADKQTQVYSSDAKHHFYGDIYPEDQQQEETRVIVKISPRKVTTNAFFS